MAPSIILVVEDNSNEQLALKELIRLFDYSVDVQSSGEKALIAFENSDYAAILMDITLPGISGYECAKRIRESEAKNSNKRTPIIALTARTEMTDRNLASDAGMDDFLSKPFAPEDLRKILLRYVYDPNNPNLKTLKPLSNST